MADETAVQIPKLERSVASRRGPIPICATVDDRLVWDVIEGKLDPLVNALKGPLGIAET